MANKNKINMVAVEYECSCGFKFRGSVIADDAAETMDEITAIVTEAHRDKPGHTLTEKKL